jgi:hypothetical protein
VRARCGAQPSRCDAAARAAHSPAPRAPALRPQQAAALCKQAACRQESHERVTLYRIDDRARPRHPRSRPPPPVMRSAPLQQRCTLRGTPLPSPGAPARRSAPPLPPRAAKNKKPPPRPKKPAAEGDAEQLRVDLGVRRHAASASITQKRTHELTPPPPPITRAARRYSCCAPLRSLTLAPRATPASSVYRSFTALATSFGQPLLR